MKGKTMPRPDGSKLTVLIIGGQGSGKTLLQKIIKDSLMGKAQVHTLQPPTEGEAKYIEVNDLGQCRAFHVNPANFGE